MTLYDADPTGGRIDMNRSFNRPWESSQHLLPGRLEADIHWLIGIVGDSRKSISVGIDGRPATRESGLLRSKVLDKVLLGHTKSTVLDGS